jgi:hypothetical protein
MNYVLRRLMTRKRLLLRKVFVERLTEPIHLNLLSLFVAIFGSYRTKVDFDLIVRQQNAFPIMFAADSARKHDLKAITIIELGVAGGAGLFNMCSIAERTRRATGVECRVVGFDSGKGMPPAIDYRDLPEHFQEGDFPMDIELLRRSLPQNAQLVIGDLEDTIAGFIEGVSPDAPIGYVSVDVDYYSSTVKALQILTAEPNRYLPIVPVYLDDIGVQGSNPWTGELLAVNEFNRDHELRKIAPFTLLRSRRIFKQPQWIDHMFAAHIHDHPLRSPMAVPRKRAVNPNEYIGWKGY